MHDKKHTLTPLAYDVTVNSATELPGSGKFTHFDSVGSYVCRRCGQALYRSKDKFSSSCGWPSFDDCVADHVLTQPDPDGLRIEICCSRCHAHLGHVFHNEGFTDKNTRHCVNAAALDFVHDTNIESVNEAVFAAGCFWGVEHLFQRVNGVVMTEVGYTGGKHDHPSYTQVCTGQSGHYEAIRILYDSRVIEYSDLCRYFFEIHNFTQVNGQGPDIGPQYASAIFYHNHQQHSEANTIIEQLITMGYEPATQLLPTQIFWPAEDYHQLYYEKNNSAPYCHVHKKIFPTQQ